MEPTFIRVSKNSNANLKKKSIELKDLLKGGGGLWGANFLNSLNNLDKNDLFI